jgi:hypothetical protein
MGYTRGRKQKDPNTNMRGALDLDLPESFDGKAFHAMSMDENRLIFRLERFTHGNNGSLDTRAREVWFRGVHSDVGGGYPWSERGFSQISLGWMLNSFKQSGAPVEVPQFDLGMQPKFFARHNELKNGEDYLLWVDLYSPGYRKVLPGDNVHKSALWTESAFTPQYRSGTSIIRKTPQERFVTGFARWIDALEKMSADDLSVTVPLSKGRAHRIPYSYADRTRVLPNVNLIDDEGWTQKMIKLQEHLPGN